MKYFFMRTRAINLLLAISTANTKFLIFEQLLWIALVMVSRIVDVNGNIRTECVKKIKGLLETEILKFVRLQHSFTAITPKRHTYN